MGFSFLVSIRLAFDFSESKRKVRWYKFLPEEINEKYSTPLLRDLQHLYLDAFDTRENVVTECYDLLQVHSSALVFKPTLKVVRNKKSKFFLIVI